MGESKTGLSIPIFCQPVRRKYPCAEIRTGEFAPPAKSLPHSFIHSSAAPRASLRVRIVIHFVIRSTLRFSRQKDFHYYPFRRCSVYLRCEGLFFTTVTKPVKKHRGKALACGIILRKILRPGYFYG